jgi:hypothetical protein
VLDIQQGGSLAMAIPARNYNRQIYWIILASLISIVMFAISSCSVSLPAAYAQTEDVNGDDIADSITENPENPNALPNWLQSGLPAFFIQLASQTLWNLKNGQPGPSSFESLIGTGTLAVIPFNPYTGEDVISTPDYSPGNFFLSFPTVDDPVVKFWTYLGDDSENYDPDLYTSGEIRPMGNGSDEYYTDGRTIFLNTIVTEEYIDSLDDIVDPSSFRESLNFPVDDDARVAIYTVARFTESLFYFIGNRPADFPNSLDGMIAIVGRKNPISWTNPYTNEPMEEVPWIQVPFYNCGDQGLGKIPDASPWPQEGIDKDALAGNYSFIAGSSPYNPNEPGERTACAQFYFYLPNGDIAAYHVVGPPRR